MRIPDALASALDRSAVNCQPANATTATSAAAATQTTGRRSGVGEAASSCSARRLRLDINRGDGGRTGRRKRRDIRPARNLDSHRIRRARAAVVLVEPGAQTPRFDPHDGVNPWIELIAAAEELDADDIFLEPLAAAGERLLDEIAEQAAGSAAVRKQRRAEHPLERGPNLRFGWRHVRSLPPLEPALLLRTRLAGRVLFSCCLSTEASRWPLPTPKSRTARST